MLFFVKVLREEALMKEPEQRGTFVGVGVSPKERDWQTALLRAQN